MPLATVPKTSAARRAATPAASPHRTECPRRRMFWLQQQRRAPRLAAAARLGTQNGARAVRAAHGQQVTCVFFNVRAMRWGAWGRAPGYQLLWGWQAINWKCVCAGFAGSARRGTARRGTARRAGVRRGGAHSAKRAQGGGGTLQRLRRRVRGRRRMGAAWRRWLQRSRGAAPGVGAQRPARRDRGDLRPRGPRPQVTAAAPAARARAPPRPAATRRAPARARRSRPPPCRRARPSPCARAQTPPPRRSFARRGM